MLWSTCWELGITTCDRGAHEQLEATQAGTFNLNQHAHSDSCAGWQSVVSKPAGRFAECWIRRPQISVVHLMVSEANRRQVRAQVKSCSISNSQQSGGCTTDMRQDCFLSLITFDFACMEGLTQKSGSHVTLGHLFFKTGQWEDSSDCSGTTNVDLLRKPLLQER